MTAGENYIKEKSLEIVHKYSRVSHFKSSQVELQRFILSPARLSKVESSHFRSCKVKLS